MFNLFIYVFVTLIYLYSHIVRCYSFILYEYICIFPFNKLVLTCIHAVAVFYSATVTVSSFYILQ